ncbi:hypothetical protein ACM66B_003862 [Microbotryomycetes sp. NB124-2]
MTRHRRRRAHPLVMWQTRSISLILALGIALAAGVVRAGDEQTSTQDRPTAATNAGLDSIPYASTSATPAFATTISPREAWPVVEDSSHKSLPLPPPPPLSGDKVLQVRAPQPGSHHESDAAVRMMMMAKVVPAVVAAPVARQDATMQPGGRAVEEGRSGGLFESSEEMVRVTRRGKGDDRQPMEAAAAVQGHGSTTASEGLDALEDKDWDKGPGHAHVEDEDERDEDEDEGEWGDDEEGEEDEDDDEEQGNGWWRRRSRL